jgi:cytochrome c oxidase cbb3-type subunit II
MERFEAIFFGSLICFALAFILSGVLPVMALDKINPKYQTLEDLAAQVPPEFEDLSTRYPKEFNDAFGSRADSKSYGEALRLGRDIYIGEGCWHCHSQYIRPVAQEEERWGPVSEAAEYNNALQMPPLWGTRRVGPDLSRQRGVHTNDWHMAHLWDPRSTTPDSIMPRYRWLFNKDGQPTKRALSLVAYLQWLGTTRDQVAGDSTTATQENKSEDE